MTSKRKVVGEVTEKVEPLAVAIEALVSAMLVYEKVGKEYQGLEPARAPRQSRGRSMAFKARLAPSPVHRYLPIRFKREERAPKLRQARAAVSDARDRRRSPRGQVTARLRRGVQERAPRSRRCHSTAISDARRT